MYGCGTIILIYRFRSATSHGEGHMFLQRTTPQCFWSHWSFSIIALTNQETENWWIWKELNTNPNFKMTSSAPEYFMAWVWTSFDEISKRCQVSLTTVDEPNVQGISSRQVYCIETQINHFTSEEFFFFLKYINYCNWNNTSWTSI